MTKQPKVDKEKYDEFVQGQAKARKPFVKGKYDRNDKANNNNVGRPLLFKDAEEMQKKIDHYFNSIRMAKPKYIKRMESSDFTYEQIQAMTDEERNSKYPAKDFNGERIFDVVWISPPHEGDLHRSIGIDSREVWSDYRGYAEFGDTVLKAKKIVEDYYSKEIAKAGSNTMGLRFVLSCCYDWKEIQYTKTETVARLEDEFDE